MGNPTHLERLGRELNCPLCLSLLSSAVSLTCNHVFCKLCIMQSMKSTASCPVCKVPFHRREVRPAPNMDSLVSIYKSMEVASGVNIFVSQNTPDTKVPDGHTLVNLDGKTNPEIHNQAETKQNVEGKELQGDKNNSGSTSVKPSFPTKKRVQGPRSPLAESPFQCGKFRSGSSESKKDGPQNGQTMFSKTPTCDGKGDFFPPPFFWLREEEDAEDLSDQTLGDQSTDTSTRIAPSFSDIMECDDEKPSETAQSGELHEKLCGEFLDSEMFEWTQKPCSPELCPSPFKMQVGDSSEPDEDHENFLTGGSKTLDTNQAGMNLKCENYKDESFDVIMEPSISSVGTRDSYDQPMRVRSKKRARKGTFKQAKCTKKDPALPIINSNKLTVVTENHRYAFNDCSEDFIDDNSRKKLHARVNATEPKCRSVIAFANKEEVTNCGIRNGETSRLYPGKSNTMKKAGRNQTKACTPRMLEGHNDSVESNLVKRKRVSRQSGTNKGGFGLSNACVPLVDSEQEVDVYQRSSRKYKDFSKEYRSLKKLKIAKSTLGEKETEPLQSIQSIPDVCILNNSSSSRSCCPLDEVILRKCEMRLINYDCAFCLSSEESEVAGEMLHYCNGKSVPADCDGGTKVIHSHRNCAEWAPNVYFEDDIAVNLEAELSRSKRIKCSLCGLKGAALGCYEKSCRRSFHVPCAKLTPCFRWDEDNFVMLCPVHSFAKLPCEKIESEEKRKKGSSQVTRNKNCDNLLSEHDCNMKRIWRTQGFGRKIVVCCSSLTVPEKNIVTEFERLSKVSIIKKWDSSVTHVIASTDENGACRRTLKTLMGILEGKWILKIDWIEACIKAMKPVDEQPYEISVDVHGIRHGPCLGRLRVLNKQPQIFDGLKFYLLGGFVQSYKAYLQDLVIAAGGMILHRKPVTEESNAPSSDSLTPKTYIIYSLELPEKIDSTNDDIVSDRKNNAAALANLTGAEVASNLWILNCIAGSKLLMVEAAR